MKRTFFRARRLISGIVALASVMVLSGSSVASAAVMVTNVFNGDTEFYAANVSNSDLLTGLPNVSTGFNATYGPEKLNNGIYAGGNIGEIAWVQDPSATSEFTLGAGVHGLGYDITTINSLAAWGSADFRNQLFAVYVKHLGDAGFTLLASVDNRPGQSGAAGSTQSTIFEDETGLLASNVVAIRFEFGDAADNYAGSTTFSEIDVFGNATAPLPAPEPGTLVAFSGALALATWRRKKRSQ